MTDEQSAAYVNGQVACANIEALGMQAENKQCEIKGNPIPYTYQHFNALIEKYAIHHNAVIEQFYPR